MAFGVMIALVALEVVLRSTGFVYHFEQLHQPGDFSEDAFVILCVGDSCTYGEGADPATQSYPAQLENILRARHPDRPFHVVNMGLPGMNSSQLARRFEGYVKVYDPDLAIVLIGNNDLWNQNDSFIYLVGEGDDVSFKRKARAWVRSWTDSLRVVRLARLVAVNLDDDRDEHHAPEGDPRRRDDHYNPMDDTHPSRNEVREGAEILGGLANVQDLYRFNFSRISKVAEREDMDLLWLDYHLGALFGETKYIDPILEEMDAEHLDLFPYFHTDDREKGEVQFDEGVRRELIFRDKWHPNARGYAVFARAVYNKLIEMGYVDGMPIPVLENIEPHKEDA
jgi:lysophospholipase L1-like esterase